MSTDAGVPGLRKGCRFNVHGILVFLKSHTAGSHVSRPVPYSLDAGLRPQLALFNHHQVIRLLYEVPIIKFDTVEERKYERRFRAEVAPAEAARQILRDLDMDGAHFVRGNLKDRLTIQRQEGFVAKRVIYFPLEQRLRVDSQRFTIPMLLQKIHLRAGYSQPYAAAKGWGLTVDIVVGAMLFWVLSGLWMWWEIKPARRWGGVFGLVGGALFVMLALTV